MAGPCTYSGRVAILLVGATSGALTFRSPAASPLPFEAAYYSNKVVTLFPLARGNARDVALPLKLASVINLISFGSDGRSAYLQIPSAVVLNLTDELVKIEFSPMRRSLVPGSGGLGDISSLTVSPRSGKIFVAASGGKDHLCGAYEIDPVAGTHHPLRVGAGPSCGGAMGKISPDGKRVLSAEGQRLSLVNVETGVVQFLGTGRAEWSPDGQWIAVSSRGQIIVINANDLSQRRTLGTSGVDGHLVWSPDSKHLLFVEREPRCSDDFETLATVDVESGGRETIQSSHCMVTSSNVGWVQSEAIR
jgi:WD40 repeat protein